MQSRLSRGLSFNILRWRRFKRALKNLFHTHDWEYFSKLKIGTKRFRMCSKCKEVYFLDVDESWRHWQCSNEKEILDFGYYNETKIERIRDRYERQLNIPRYASGKR